MERRSMAPPHRRYNPLTDEWVLVSPARSSRPWLGENLFTRAAPAPSYDPACYLCPGNTRANGEINPRYEGAFVFRNDFPALDDGGEGLELDADPLLLSQAERGECRVVSFSPRHDSHLAQLSEAQVVGVVDCWAEQYADLAGRAEIAAVTIFENRGSAMGASNPHPHGQIWAESSIPNELAKETAALQRYVTRLRECLLCRYAAVELERAQRVVLADDELIAVVPYWAIWPFETLVLPRAHCGSVAELSSSARRALAKALQRLTAGYDRLFGAPFPYSMGFHQSPADASHSEWHLHAHFYPPLREATLRKYMVGYEMLAQPQRDFTPEEAAARLQSVV
jgi:UDPglucose--hexose-1-phosphate uridylyltransferase